VSVIRANWVSAVRADGTLGSPQLTPPLAFYPHYLDGGQPYNAAFADGQISRCVATADGQRCLTPRVNFRSDFLPWAQGSYVESVWLGSLLSDKQDKTLTFYRRNRVYDPLTRQFTQEDPMGLAGGMNLYGFASGDPVNFSDPFGLCQLPNGGEGSEAECRKLLMDRQDAAMHDPKFKPSREATHCNQATFCVATSVGAQTQGFLDDHGDPLMADQIRAMMANPANGYIEVTAAQAQAFGDRGEVAYVTGPGHIATIRPDVDRDFKTYPGRGPLIANVGKKNGVFRVNWVFKEEERKQVKYYINSAVVIRGIP
jgi:RHS repeat-associated protein